MSVAPKRFEKVMNRPFIRRLRSRRNSEATADPACEGQGSAALTVGSTDIETDESANSSRDEGEVPKETAAAEDDTAPVKESSRLRRASAAVGGGALLSVGAVLMVTPLHPVGHAMAIGGGCILGSEFEGPRKAAQSAKDRLAKLRGKESAETSGNATEDDQVNEETRQHPNHHQAIRMDASTASAGVSNEQMESEIRSLSEVGTQREVLYAMFPQEVVDKVLEKTQVLQEEAGQLLENEDVPEKDQDLMKDQVVENDEVLKEEYVMMENAQVQKEEGE